MLLYDQIVEHCCVAQRKSMWSLTDDAVYSVLSESHVYEISDCSALQVDWDREKHRPIRKDPPCNPCWVEWDMKSDFGSVTMGFSIKTASGNAIDILNRGIVGGDELKYNADMNKWFGFGFARIGKMLDSQSPLRKIQNKIFKNSGMTVITANPDGSNMEFDMVESDHHDEMKLFGFESIFQGCNISLLPWPAFMAFALLHCKNIVTVDHPPDARVLKHCRKQGLPPRVTYKTLRVEVPSIVRIQSSDDTSFSDDSPKVRQHICSGHFRELRSDRFKNKQGEWIWIPQHVRGDAALGQVITRHKLV